MLAAVPRSHWGWAFSPAVLSFSHHLLLFFYSCLLSNYFPLTTFPHFVVYSHFILHCRIPKVQCHLLNRYGYIPKVCIHSVNSIPFQSILIVHSANSIQFHTVNFTVPSITFQIICFFFSLNPLWPFHHPAWKGFTTSTLGFTWTLGTDGTSYLQYFGYYVPEGAVNSRYRWNILLAALVKVDPGGFGGEGHSRLLQGKPDLQCIILPLSCLTRLK